MQDVKMNVKAKLSAAWITAMFLYVYGDFLTIFSPGMVDDLLAGDLGGMQTTQVVLLGIAIFMAIPSFMVFLSIALKARANRWANIIVGTIYTAVALVTGFGALMGGVLFYVFLAILEAALCMLIVRFAWMWPRTDVA